jgi:hypothetical protein
MDAEKQELWKKRMENYEASGLSGKKWCEEEGVSEGQFWYWKKKWKDSQKEEGVSTSWAPLVVADAALQKPGLTVRIGVAEIEVQSDYHEILLQNVVRTLMSIC